MPRHQLGILFVHGIGEQPEGQTLLAFGEPLLAWIGDWIRRAEGGPAGSFEIVRSKLTPSKLGRSVPPHAEVDVQFTREKERVRTSWLVAESWWGGDVQRPSFGKLAGWMLTIGSSSILSHATKRWQSGRSKFARVGNQVLAHAIWLPLATALQISVLLLSILAILPIPVVRRGLSSFLLLLTGVLGDSFVLLESELQRAAIINKTREALCWLAKKCDQVVVVAHSQGAAVAHHALRTAEPENVRLLFTFGSGLAKLEELGQMKQAPVGQRAAAFAPPMFLTALLMAYQVYREGLDDAGEFAMLFIGIAVLFVFMIVILAAREQQKRFAESLGKLSLTSIRPDLQWRDVYSSHDLVPNGRLAPEDNEIAGYKSRDVLNFRSWIKDHTTYWSNPCEFIPRVAQAIDETAKLGLFSGNASARLESAAAAHRRNVWWWTSTKWATWLSVVLLFVLYPDQLLAFGQKLVVLMRKANLETIVERLDATARTLFPSRSPEEIAAIALRLTGAAIPIALLVGYRPGYRLLWQWWDKRQLEAAIRPSRAPARADRNAIDLLVLSAGFVPLIVVGLWPYLRRIQLGYAIWSLVLAGYTIVLLVALSGLFKGRLLVDALRGVTDARAKLKPQLFTVGMVLGFTLMIFTVALPVLQPFRDVVISFWIGAFLLAFLVQRHTALLEFAREQIGGRSIETFVILAPLLLVLAGMILFAFTTTPYAAELGLVSGILGTAMTAAGLYIFALLFVYLIVKWRERRIARE